MEWLVETNNFRKSNDRLVDDNRCTKFGLFRGNDIQYEEKNHPGGFERDAIFVAPFAKHRNFKFQTSNDVGYSPSTSIIFVRHTEKCCKVALLCCQ